MTAQIGLGGDDVSEECHPPTASSAPRKPMRRGSGSAPRH